MNRRTFLNVGAVSTTLSLSGWLGRLAAAAPDQAKKNKSVILIWLNGGPATIDLWDVKEGHANGGPVKSIRTNAPDVRISEYLPKLADHGKDIAIVRSMSTKEGDHSRATYLMRTGNLPLGALQYPTLGSIVSKEIGDKALELPNFISIAPQRFFNVDAFGPGFLGPQYAPLIIAENRGAEVEFKAIDGILTVENMNRSAGVDAQRFADRREMLRLAQSEFNVGRPGAIPESHASAYDRAARLMTSDAGKVFDLSTEKTPMREKYGKNLFGQGCLLARRLVERGVSFVEVNHGFWDTHGNNFDQVKNLAAPMDQGLAALISDLKDRGLFDSTLILCMGEFGRTPRINAGNGRDHYPNAWAAMLAGGGIKGGTIVGKTSTDGTTVESKPTSTIDLLATVCAAVKIDGDKQNMSNIGRPIRIVDRAAQPLTEILG